MLELIDVSSMYYCEWKSKSTHLVRDPFAKVHLKPGVMDVRANWKIRRLLKSDITAIFYILIPFPYCFMEFQNLDLYVCTRRLKFRSWFVDISEWYGDKIAVKIIR